MSSLTYTSSTSLHTFLLLLPRLSIFMLSYNVLTTANELELFMTREEDVTFILYTRPYEIREQLQLVKARRTPGKPDIQQNIEDKARTILNRHNICDAETPLILQNMEACVHHHAAQTWNDGTYRRTNDLSISNQQWSR